MVSERQRAREMDYPSPIHETIEDTHGNYNEVVERLLARPEVVGGEVPANILIASIALGIAVDDTIHFLHHFQDHYKKEGDTEAAILHSMAHSGRALVVTSIILCAGFFVYIAATMVNMQRFGALIGITVIMALLLDLIVTPALLRTFYKTNEPTQEEGQHA